MRLCTAARDVGAWSAVFPISKNSFLFSKRSAPIGSPFANVPSHTAKVALKDKYEWPHQDEGKMMSELTRYSDYASGDVSRYNNNGNYDYQRVNKDIMNDEEVVNDAISHEHWHAHHRRISYYINAYAHELFRADRGASPWRMVHVGEHARVYPSTYISGPGQMTIAAPLGSDGFKNKFGLAQMRGFFRGGNDSLDAEYVTTHIGMFTKGVSHPRHAYDIAKAIGLITSPSSEMASTTTTIPTSSSSSIASSSPSKEEIFDSQPEISKKFKVPTKTDNTDKAEDKNKGEKDDGMKGKRESQEDESKAEVPRIPLEHEGIVEDPSLSLEDEVRHAFASSNPDTASPSGTSDIRSRETASAAASASPPSLAELSRSLVGAVVATISLDDVKPLASLLLLMQAGIHKGLRVQAPLYIVPKSNDVAHFMSSHPYLPQLLEKAGAVIMKVGESPTIENCVRMAVRTGRALRWKATDDAVDANIVISERTLHDMAHTPKSTLRLSVAEWNTQKRQENTKQKGDVQHQGQEGQEPGIMKSDDRDGEYIDVYRKSIIRRLRTVYTEHAPKSANGRHDLSLVDDVISQLLDKQQILPSITTAVYRPYLTSTTSAVLLAFAGSMRYNPKRHTLLAWSERPSDSTTPSSSSSSSSPSPIDDINLFALDAPPFLYIPSLDPSFALPTIDNFVPSLPPSPKKASIGGSTEASTDAVNINPGTTHSESDISTKAVDPPSSDAGDRSSSSLSVTQSSPVETDEFNIPFSSTDAKTSSPLPSAATSPDLIDTAEVLKNKKRINRLTFFPDALTAPPPPLFPSKSLTSPSGKKLVSPRDLALIRGEVPSLQLPSSKFPDSFFAPSPFSSSHLVPQRAPYSPTITASPPVFNEVDLDRSAMARSLVADLHVSAFPPVLYPHAFHPGQKSNIFKTFTDHQRQRHNRNLNLHSHQHDNPHHYLTGAINSTDSTQEDQSVYASSDGGTNDRIKESESKLGGNGRNVDDNTITIDVTSVSIDDTSPLSSMKSKYIEAKSKVTETKDKLLSYMMNDDEEDVNGMVKRPPEYFRDEEVELAEKHKLLYPLSYLVDGRGKKVPKPIPSSTFENVGYSQAEVNKYLDAVKRGAATADTLATNPSLPFESITGRTVVSAIHFGAEHRWPDHTPTIDHTIRRKADDHDDDVKIQAKSGDKDDMNMDKHEFVDISQSGNLIKSGRALEKADDGKEQNLGGTTLEAAWCTKMAYPIGSFVPSTAPWLDAGQFTVRGRNASESGIATNRYNEDKHGPMELTQGEMQQLVMIKRYSKLMEYLKSIDHKNVDEEMTGNSTQSQGKGMAKGGNPLIVSPMPWWDQGDMTLPVIRLNGSVTAVHLSDCASLYPPPQHYSNSHAHTAEPTKVNDTNSDGSTLIKRIVEWEAQVLGIIEANIDSSISTSQAENHATDLQVEQVNKDLSSLHMSPLKPGSLLHRLTSTLFSPDVYTTTTPPLRKFIGEDETPSVAKAFKETLKQWGKNLGNSSLARVVKGGFPDLQFDEKSSDEGMRAVSHFDLVRARRSIQHIQALATVTQKQRLTRDESLLTKDEDTSSDAMDQVFERMEHAERAEYKATPGAWCLVVSGDNLVGADPRRLRTTRPMNHSDREHYVEQVLRKADGSTIMVHTNMGHFKSLSPPVLAPPHPLSEFGAPAALACSRTGSTNDSTHSPLVDVYAVAMALQASGCRMVLAEGFETEFLTALKARGILAFTLPPPTVDKIQHGDRIHINNIAARLQHSGGGEQTIQLKHMYLAIGSTKPSSSIPSSESASQGATPDGMKETNLWANYIPIDPNDLIGQSVNKENQNIKEITKAVEKYSYLAHDIRFDVDEKNIHGNAVLQQAGLIKPLPVYQRPITLTHGYRAHEIVYFRTGGSIEANAEYVRRVEEEAGDRAMRRTRFGSRMYKNNADI